MAVKVVGVNPGLALWIILPFTVWWIYIADHLVEGFRLKEKIKTQDTFSFTRIAKNLL